MKTARHLVIHEVADPILGVLLLNEKSLSDAELQIRIPADFRIVSAEIVSAATLQVIGEKADLVSRFARNLVLRKSRSHWDERSFGAVAGRQGIGEVTLQNFTNEDLADGRIRSVPEEKAGSNGHLQIGI